MSGKQTSNQYSPTVRRCVLSSMDLRPIAPHGAVFDTSPLLFVKGTRARRGSKRGPHRASSSPSSSASPPPPGGASLYSMRLKNCKGRRGEALQDGEPGDGGPSGWLDNGPRCGLPGPSDATFDDLFFTSPSGFGEMGVRERQSRDSPSVAVGATAPAVECVPRVFNVRIM